MSKIDYSGSVTLCCEDGGYCISSILLDDFYPFGPEGRRNLTELIEEKFTCVSNRNGDKRCTNKLRIRIESI